MLAAAAGEESPPAGVPARAPTDDLETRTPDRGPLTADAETGDDRSALTEELDRHNRKREELAARAPRGFDPAALFLLTLAPHNLFEPASARPGETRGRCKGCGAILRRSEWERHQLQHKRRSK